MFLLLSFWVPASDFRVFICTATWVWKSLVMNSEVTIVLIKGHQIFLLLGSVLPSTASKGYGSRGTAAGSTFRETYLHRKGVEL